ncbi:unnamed protein product [Arabidopsis lyrata]|uniref:Uncharacterized protein n=1 Tax=Arabidopsis lyrata subsp. lyrata TaxID=81972 RepID=D7MPI6_ARALL|nr:uncharacterized protein LOC9300110 [Arabidopsis lyrata subsp. lyrata]EFH40293.1 hypothetical protein ARALYDRAFT_918012 [Arabidopsis lyrata subsp. lyrata]CAH8279109.1 unnamed protein product [Arabidopsis lyrata]|eukprot:XP_002864034.1 uncharacterized protein LOC9300110 [Arabidopsis lyrata subsp. lyrata]
MGNCQAVDTARVVIQHPNGKEEKLSCPVSASYVMKMNPGHCVSLLISTTALSATSSSHGGPLRLTRIKLLRPTDTLVLGHVYRLITTKEVMKGLMAKKCSKLKKESKWSEDKLEMVKAINSTKLDNEDQLQMKKQEKERSRISRSWQPSLQSISEGGSS